MYCLINYSVKRWEVERNQRLNGIIAPKYQTKTENKGSSTASSSCSLFQFFLPPSVLSYEVESGVFTRSNPLLCFLCRSGCLVCGLCTSPHLASPLHTLCLWTVHTHPDLPGCKKLSSFLFALISLDSSLSLTHSPSPIFLNPTPSFSETPDSRRKTRLLMFACLLTHYSINSTRKDTKRIEQNGIN